MPFFGWILLGLAISVVSYLIMPKPKPQSAATQKMDDPTAEAGLPIVEIFGEITIKNPNILWYGDKKTSEYKVNA